MFRTPAAIAALAIALTLPAAAIAQVAPQSSPTAPHGNVATSMPSAPQSAPPSGQQPTAPIATPTPAPPPTTKEVEDDDALAAIERERQERLRAAMRQAAERDAIMRALIAGWGR